MLYINGKPTYANLIVGGTWQANGTWTIPAVTLGGAVTGNSQNITGLGSVGCGALTATGLTITSQVIQTDGAWAFQKAYTISTTATTLTLNPATDVILKTTVFNQTDAEVLSIYPSAGTNSVQQIRLFTKGTQDQSEYIAINSPIAADNINGIDVGVDGATAFLKRWSSGTPGTAVSTLQIGGGTDGIATLAFYAGTTLQCNWTDGAFAFQKATTISTTAGALTLAPATTIQLTPLTGQAVNIGTSANFKRFYSEITLATDNAETDVGLTPAAVILSAAIRVSVEITGLDEADHHIQLGINGNASKYIDVAQGGAATTISVNKKGKYTFDPTTDTEAAALKLTITGGADQIPTAGKVYVEVIYLDSSNLSDV